MLINNITDINRVITASKASTFERLEQHLQNAEKTYAISLLGTETYNVLANYSTNDDGPKYTSPSRTALVPSDPDPTNEQKARALVLWHMQHAIVHLAYFVGFDALTAFISDGGFQRKESDTVKSLFKYQEDNLKKYFLGTGMNSLDNALEVLETEISHFHTFEPMLSALKSKIFPNSKTFNHHYNINNSRLIFLRLKQHIKTVEELEIEPVVGQGNFKYIMTELAKANPAQKVTNILPYLRDPIAYFATALLMEESGADISERGLYFTGQRSITNSDYIMPANEQRITYLVERNRDIARQYMNRLRRMLSDYEWDGEFGLGRLHNRDNTGKRTFFA